MGLWKIHWHSFWPTRTEAKPTIPKQYGRVKQSLLNPTVNPWIEVLSHLRHYLRFLVELWPVGTKLRTRGTSISFPPRPPFSVILSSCLSCDRTGGCPRLPLFTQFPYLLRFTWHFLLAKNVFAFLSYFCLIKRHPLFKTLDTPIFC